jgi:phosphoesterase RecJ-like protein
MELTPKQQTAELIKNATKILVITHEGADGDAIGSVLALSGVLKKMGKDVISVVPSPIPQPFTFLGNITDLSPTFSGVKDFIITVNTSQTKADKISYRNFPEEKKLMVIVTPEQGNFTPQDLSFSYGAFKFDLIFVLDSPELDRLGSLYDQHTELFYETPVVNIDHHPSNDYFGKVNWIDLTATSTAEILVALIESLGREQNLIDANVATCLLTGIISDTDSFQNNNTTPKSFTTAAQLVAAGAEQQQIIRHLYKTRALSTLKLWGKILTNIHEEKPHRFIWSKVSSQELADCQAKPEEISGVIDELLKTAPAIDFVLLISERNGLTHGSLRSVEKGVDVNELAKTFGGGGHEQAAAFKIKDKPFEQVVLETVDRLKAIQAKKLGMVKMSSESLARAPVSSENVVEDTPKDSPSS